MQRSRPSLFQPLDNLVEAARSIVADVAVELRHAADVGRRAKTLVRGLRDANAQGIAAKARRRRAHTRHNAR